MTAPVTTQRAPVRRSATNAAPAPRRAVPVRQRPGPARHLRAVPPRQRRRRLAAVAVIAFTLMAVFGLVSFNVFIVQSQFRLERLQQRVETERAKFERLRLDAAHLSSPQRILDIARNQLGLTQPRSITYVTVPATGGAGPADATGAVRAWAQVKPYLAAQP